MVVGYIWIILRRDLRSLLAGRGKASVKERLGSMGAIMIWALLDLHSVMGPGASSGTWQESFAEIS